ncbi:MAG: DEAD/DEAH box helicase [Nitrospirota bacterium]
MAVQLKEFLETYADQLAETLEAKLTPLYNPEKPTGVDAYAQRLLGLKRQLFRVQAEVVKGMAKALYQAGRQRLFIVGEQGCGKTTLAHATVAVAPRPQRVLVVCPGHLVEKWLREARAIIPDVQTIDLSVQHVITMLDELRTIRTRPERHEVYVISKERLKLSYGWRPAAWKKGRYGGPHCPACGVRACSGDDLLVWSQLETKRRSCGICGEPLWQADPKIRRMAPVEYMKKRLKGFFDVMVLDEVHELKGGDTLQGQAMGGVLGLARRSLKLTGTLNGGYADDLFYLLFRTDPNRMKKDGFEHGQVSSFMERYGVIEIVKDLQDGDDHRYGRGRKKQVMVRKRPGVSPVVIGRHLLDKTVFIRLADVIDGLPPYEERVVTIAMNDEQRAEYAALERKLRQAVRTHGRRALGALLQSLLSYPDSCPLFGEEVKIRDRVGQAVETVTAPRIQMPAETLLPKERELLDLIAQERAEGRKSLIYVNFTESRDIRPRLKSIAEAAGHRVGVLDKSIAPKKREAWIADHQRDIDVLVTNPELVKTGLDLYAFPNIMFYQPGYNLFTLRQAARRSWRIGQSQPVKVTFLCYESTMQSIAIYLIAKKLEAALLVEGDLPEGLAEYGQSHASLIEEMGKALADGQRYSGAEAAWAEFRKKEIEAQLAIGQSADQLEQIIHRGPPEALGSLTQPNVTIKVSILSNKRRKTTTSVLEVTPEDLDSLAETHGALQFALF